MGANTPEYLTLIGCTSELTNAVKPHLESLSDELLANGFISQDNRDNLNNQFIDKTNRASQMMSVVRTRVQLNEKNFLTFICILLKNVIYHRDILEILDRKYQSLGGQNDTGIALALSALDKPLQPSAQLSASVSPRGTSLLNDTMSAEQFDEWLGSRGMTKREDRQKIIQEEINAQSFPYLEEDDIREVIGRLSIGGRGVFRKLWRENKISDTPSLSGRLDEELSSTMHHKISHFLKDIPPVDLRSLGGALGISRSKMVRIPDEELAESLVASWLRKEDEVLSVGKPSLRCLATHLKAIGQNGKAHDILSSDGRCIL